MDSIRQTITSLFGRGPDDTAKKAEERNFPPMGTVREQGDSIKGVSWSSVSQKGATAGSFLIQTMYAPTSHIGEFMLNSVREKRGKGENSLDYKIAAKNEEYNEKSAAFSQSRMGKVKVDDPEKLKTELHQIQQDLEALQSEKKNLDRLEFAGNALCFPLLAKDAVIKVAKELW